MWVVMMVVVLMCHERVHVYECVRVCVCVCVCGEGDEGCVVSWVMLIRKLEH